MGGLKFFSDPAQSLPAQSHPTRDGWIEIHILKGAGGIGVSPIPHGMGGLKSSAPLRSSARIASHPTRDGWIEIGYPCHILEGAEVPSHTGWVD